MSVWTSRAKIEGLFARRGLESAHPFDHGFLRCVREFLPNFDPP